MTIPINKVKWDPCWRIIPDIYPPINLFEQVCNPQDLDLVLELEARTNPIIKDQVGNLSLVPKEDRISGPGTAYIMASFTLIGSDSRFSDGTYGVFYAAKDLHTAIAETKHHREIFLRNTNAKKIEIGMQVLKVKLDADLHNIRGMRDQLNSVYLEDSYTESQRFAKELKKNNSNGIVYESVRDKNGECVAVFKPKVLSECYKHQNLCYMWDGTQITDVYEKRDLN